MRGAGGQIGTTPSGPVIATFITGMTARKRSVAVSLVGWPVTESSNRTFGGNGSVTRTSPLSTRLEKSLAFSPFVRKSSASTGLKSASSAFLSNSRFASSASNLARSERIREQQQQALDSRIVIEQAKGIIAEQHNVTVDSLRDATEWIGQVLTGERPNEIVPDGFTGKFAMANNPRLSLARQVQVL